MATGLLSFLAGFTYNVVGADEVTPPAVKLTQINAADVTADAGKDTTASEVKPLEMFWETYSLIRQRYRLSDAPTWKDEKLMYAALDGMLRSLNDPYTRFLDPDAYREMVEMNTGQFEGIGAYLKEASDGRHIMLAPISNGPAARAGLKRGDLLLKIGEVSAVGMDTDKAKNLIRGTKGTKVKLTISRLIDLSKPEGPKNKRKNLSLLIERDVIQPEKVEYSAGPAGHPKDSDIGYIHLQQFNEETEPQLDEALSYLTKKKIKGLVIDLRDNPGGLLDTAISVASHFIPDGPVLYIQEAGGNRRAYNVDRRKYQNLNMPIVVLVNHFSASASEILSGALKDNHIAKLVGETTFGKGLVQTIMPLDSVGNAGAMKITTAKYFTPAGTDINRKGIKPDVEVVAEHAASDPFGPGNGGMADPQLNRAIQVIRADMASGTPAAKRK